MATEPPPFVKFKNVAMPERVAVYQLALDLSKQLYTIIELTEGVERFHLRDMLDKKSTAIPMFVSRGLATADMSERRELYKKARKVLGDCTAILDMLSLRGTVEEEVLANTRATATELGAQLHALTQPPPKAY
jgi:hypothetical protein